MVVLSKQGLAKLRSVLAQRLTRPGINSPDRVGLRTQVPSFREEVPIRASPSLQPVSILLQ